MCSCRVRTDPERDGEVPRNVIPERRVKIWQEGHPSPCQEPREEGSVSAAAAQPSFWLRPGTPMASLGKGPLLHPRPCSCCQHQIPSASTRSLCQHQIPLPALALQPPHWAVTALLPPSRDGTANVPPLPCPRAGPGEQPELQPHLTFAFPQPRDQPGTRCHGGKKSKFLEELVPALPKRSRS